MNKHKVTQFSPSQQICKYTDCGLASLTRGYCKKHYTRILRNGHCNLKIRSRTNTFWDYIEKAPDDPNACWKWLGGTDKDGYGRIKVNQKVYSAHRWSFFLHNGVHAKNCVLHSCDNRPCCNPRHLREGTPQDNSRDMLIRGRSLQGEKQLHAKLTGDIVRELKTDLILRMPTRKVAVKYNISRSVVCDIKQGRRWKHILVHK